MPAKPRNNRVELRLTELEKKDWSEAAGGVRRLSEWIRAVCNARVAELADAAASSTAAERREGSTPSPSTDDSGKVPAARESRAVVIPNVKPVIVEDAIQREIQSEGVRPSANHRERRPRAQGSEGDFAAPGLQDQAHRESRSLPATEAVPGADSSRPGEREVTGEGASASPPALIEQEASNGQCPRWMHHRPGVYCGACKRVIAK